VQGVSSVFSFLRLDTTRGASPRLKKMKVLAGAARGPRQHLHLFQATCLQGERKGKLKSPTW